MVPPDGIAEMSEVARGKVTEAGRYPLMAPQFDRVRGACQERSSPSHGTMIDGTLSRTSIGAFGFFHHKHTMSTVTDIQPTMRENSDRPVAGPMCAIFQLCLGIRQSPICQFAL